MQDLYIQAEAFISSMQQFEGDQSNSDKWRQRLKSIKKSIEETGTYIHTQQELSFGAKLAWRNSNRCIGRHFWRQLDVFDCRALQTKEAILNALENHVTFSYNKGAIKSAVTIFAPKNQISKSSDPVRILNHQLIRYAGFKNDDGTILGDPHSLSFTQKLEKHGWKAPEKNSFTPLPWLIQINGKVQDPYPIFEEKPHLLTEVQIEHPENEAFKTLGLKWYSTPILSDMALLIGGIHYPCAPFNGWYMGTEIGARNLADETRYDYLPQIAKIFQLDTKNNRSLWRDRAIIELNRAVLYSFDRDKVKIGDHHAITRQFEKFCDNEAKSKCPITGDWTWLVPPISASQTPTFSQEFDPSVVKHTNFFYQASFLEADNQTSKPGAGKCPYHIS
ncbi:MAG: nitric oxide synthase oxygenase [Coraliomargaritaceae bacterium]